MRIANQAREIAISVGNIELWGNLSLPEGSKSLIVFAHGSGSSRFSPRNTYVAGTLNERGFGTLLCDLLTPDEEMLDEQTRELRFNIPMLADRVAAITKTLSESEGTSDLQFGLFGASTGAAAALIAAAKLPHLAKAVVSRGGRPDLAGRFLAKVKAPTLLIVGGWDEQVIELNEQALALIPAQKKLVIVPQATHLFEEPGKLEEVARLAGDWFAKYLLA